MSIYVRSNSSFPQVTEVSATSGTNRNSSTDALLDSMTATPPAGKYLVLFNCDMESATAGAAISFSYYLAGTQVASSLRKIIPFDGGALSAGAARGTAQLQSTIIVTGTQAIEVRWSISSGTVSAAARSLIYMRVG